LAGKHIASGECASAGIAHDDMLVQYFFSLFWWKRSGISGLDDSAEKDIYFSLCLGFGTTRPKSAALDRRRFWRRLDWRR
jgi:hypothetical protein